MTESKSQSDLPAIDRFRAIVAEASRKHPDPKKARTVAKAAAKRDAALCDELLDYLFDVTVAELVYRDRKSVAIELKRVKPAVVAKPGKPWRTIESVAAASATAMRSLLDWAMPDGRLLGDLFGRDLEPLIAEETNFARAHTGKAAFFRAVRALTPDDKTVKACVTPKRAQELWQSANGGQGEHATHERSAADADCQTTGDSRVDHAVGAAA